LENLVVCRCFNSDHQDATVQKLAALMMEDGPFATVIIDSGAVLRFYLRACVHDRDRFAML